MIAALQFLADLDENAAQAIDFGDEDRAYLEEITHTQRRKESLAARLALKDALTRAHGDDTAWTIYRRGRGKTFVRRTDETEGNLGPAHHVSRAATEDAASPGVSKQP